ncbi:hypothetical protein [Herminiimonas contaminans]|uniref:GtrA-like protein n=1 Tax=Herminiimonas contaminans TaxID=1111140 RepID=A0ABS0ESJ6_9BURK|nr:hypothetical protein [Herminiimonas contaminans]MBF8177817.1 hypothetical protein [Herminiimonas contaminans]
MRINDYNHDENACRIGLTLAVIAVGLNILNLYVIKAHQAIDLFGLSCGIASLVSSYLAESYHRHANTFRIVRLRERLVSACLLACALSYSAWIFSVFLTF